MTRRLFSVLLAVTMMVTACTDAPDPGDLAAFCSLLEVGTGLSTTATEGEFAQLALVAPPDIGPTIESLQTQARDFDELLNVQDPDLAALFKAKFDPAAERERSALDQYAENSCNMVVDRPPSTRWTNYVRENQADAGWRDAVAVQFDVDAAADRIVAATAVFTNAPAQMGLVEDVCQAAADFLVTDGADTATVRVLIGTVVVLEQTSATGVCQLP